MQRELPRSSSTPEQQSKRPLATLVRWAVGAATTQALVIAIEDLHCADPRLSSARHYYADTIAKRSARRANAARL
jgi:hypothetical protein